VAFHDQADQRFALLLRLAEELLGSGLDALIVGAYFDLRHGFDVDGDALRGIEILRGCHVEGHQFQ
jgi:hypothetical protein